INKVVVSNYGVSLYIDDVTVNGLTITNQGFETTTGWTYAETNGNFIDGSYDSLQHNTGAKSYKLSFPNSTGLALGQDSSITQTVTTINKTLTFYHHDSVSTTSGNASGVWYKQALVNGVVVWEADVTDLGTAWRSETVNFTTSSPSFTLKFRLINKVVVSNYGVSLYIDDVTVNGLTITNQGFETTTGWTYAETNGNFIDGSYDSLQHNTGAKSYKLSFPNSTGLALGQDSSITQTVSVP
ncbi:hypothetical protein, partial [Paenibacillus sp. LjRoot153]|uniref:hypothetical protein n=1 Tax=Paenibacillus sp. LjRoot153 TaxID=3342270 RepID=UPI003F4FAB8B